MPTHRRQLRRAPKPAHGGEFLVFEIEGGGGRRSDKDFSNRRRIDASTKDGPKHLPAATARSTEDIIGWLLNGSISSFSSGLSPCPSFVSWRGFGGGTSAADPTRATETRIVDVNFMMTVREWE